MNDKNKEVIFFASEIGQYHYCPVSWFLLKSGYKSESTRIEHGVKKHQKYGSILNKKETYYLLSKYLFIGGIIGIFLTCLSYIFEVLI